MLVVIIVIVVVDLIDQLVEPFRVILDVKHKFGEGHWHKWVSDVTHDVHRHLSPFVLRHREKVYHAVKGDNRNPSPVLVDSRL